MAIVRLNMAKARARRRKYAEIVGQPIHSSRLGVSADSEGGKATGGDQDNPLYTRVVDPSSAGWPAMYRVVRESDVNKVDDCRDDIDTLLVFAGLYSAVLSAFLIESYKNLQEDKQDTIVGLLEKIATQNFVSSGVFTNSTTTLSPSVPFEPPLWAIRVNILWFASLVLSIAVASLGILVKQWLREFLAMEYSSPRLRLRARNYRQPALNDWKVFEIAAVLPMILQISVGLFFVGLCFFTSAVHESVRNTTIPIVCAWAFFFTITIIAPLFSPRCPFKTTFLKTVLKAGRRYLAPHARRITIYISWHTATVYQKILYRLHIKTVGTITARSKPELKDILEEEDVAIAREQEDSNILLAVDAVVSDDNLLPTMLEVLSQGLPETIVDFVLLFIQQREGIREPSAEKLDFTRDIDALSSQTWTTLVETLVKLLKRNPEELSKDGKVPAWMMKSAVLLLSKHSGSDVGLQALRNLIESTDAQDADRTNSTHHGHAELLFSVEPTLVDAPLLVTMLDILQCRGPETAVDLALRVLQHHTKDTLLEEGVATSMLDLTKVPDDTWRVVVDTLSALLSDNRDTLFTPDGQTIPWVTKSTIFLLASHSSAAGTTALHNLMRSESGRKMHPARRGYAEVLFSVYTTFADDSRLETMLDLLKYEDPATTADFVLRIILHRIDFSPPLTSILDLGKISSQAWSVLVKALETLLTHDIDTPSERGSPIPLWAVNSTILLLSRHVDNAGGQALRRLIALDKGAKRCAAIICHLSRGFLSRFAEVALADAFPLPEILRFFENLGPQIAVDLIIGIIQDRIRPTALPASNLKDIPNLRALSPRTWAAVVATLSGLLQRNREITSTYRGQVPIWMIDSTILLLSQHPDDRDGVQALQELVTSDNGMELCAVIIPRLSHAVLSRFFETVLVDDLPLSLVRGSLQHRDPQVIVDVVRRVVRDRTGVSLPKGPSPTSTFTVSLPEGRSTPTLNLSGLSSRICTMLIHALANSLDSTSPYPDLFYLLTRLLLWRCQRDEELVGKELEALQAVLHIGVHGTHRLDVNGVLYAFYRHPTHVYGWMAYYSAMLPAHSSSADLSLGDPTSGPLCAFLTLFEDPHNPDKDRHSIELAHIELLDHAISAIEGYCKGDWETYKSALESIDPVKLCVLYLHTWVSRVAHSESPTPQNPTLSQSWAGLWTALARAIMKYYSRSQVLLPRKVLEREAVYSRDCLLKIHQWRERMGSPEDLEKALCLFDTLVPVAEESRRTEWLMAMRDESDHARRPQDCDLWLIYRGF